MRQALQTAALLVVVVILAGGFVYYYTSASSLKQAGLTVCRQATSVAIMAEGLIENVTLTLQSQIQNDNSLIQTLDSTRPAGYTNMIATLNSQIAQDLALITNYDSLLTVVNGGVSSASSPCLSFNQP
jgi:hypothetical protein